MKKNLSNEISQETLKKIYNCIIMAIGVMVYFLVLNLAYNAMKLDRLLGDIEVFSGVFLVVGIYLLERAYKKDSGVLAISAIEFLVLSIHSLTIMHVITMLQYDFKLYLIASSYVFAIYYILKSIIIYTRGRMEYAKTFSDISEIVKKDEPQKKEATKKSNIKNENMDKQKEISTKESKTKKQKDKKTEKIATKETNANKEKEEKTKKTRRKRTTDKKTGKMETEDKKEEQTKNPKTRKRKTKESKSEK